MPADVFSLLHLCTTADYEGCNVYSCVFFTAPMYCTNCTGAAAPRPPAVLKIQFCLYIHHLKEVLFKNLKTKL